MEKRSNILKAVTFITFYVIVMFTFATKCNAQVIGKTSTEQYKASFETKINIDSLMDYNGPTIPIQILKCGIGDELYEQYPELKEKIGRAHV